MDVLWRPVPTRLRAADRRELGIRERGQHRLLTPAAGASPPRRYTGAMASSHVEGGAAAQVLRRRIQALDADLLPVTDTGDQRLVQVVRVMQAATNTSVPAESGGQPVLDPNEADAVVAGCRLLGSIAATDPELVGGPLPDQAQHWIATSRGLPAGHVPVLDERRFGRTHDRPNSVKPFDHGLYT